MNDSDKKEILDRLDEGEKKLLEVAGALPVWVKDEYPHHDVAELISEVSG